MDDEKNQDSYDLELKMSSNLFKGKTHVIVFMIRYYFLGHIFKFA